MTQILTVRLKQVASTGTWLCSQARQAEGSHTLQATVACLSSSILWRGHVHHWRPLCSVSQTQMEIVAHKPLIKKGGGTVGAGRGAEQQQPCLTRSDSAGAVLWKKWVAGVWGGCAPGWL